MNQYAMYLRKSRADMEAEARGEGETLARHRAALTAMAIRRGLNVVEEYAEIVTGDSIAARPQMQRLLNDVKKGLYAGVIVNDVDRLGRGDSIDQEIIKYTFMAGHCIIITPSRDIDPANPTDVDMLDFSMFFARFEYRKISQRLMQGRTRSAVSGNYVCARVPYGYRKYVDGKRITLVPDEKESQIVKMIFEWYAHENISVQAIATRLTSMGIKSYMGLDFHKATVKQMLKNQIYIGNIVWGKTRTVMEIEDGRRTKKHVKSRPVIAENAHPAIISNELFETVQETLKKRHRNPPINVEKHLSNPLAGLMRCPICKKPLQQRGARKGPFKDYIITCVTYNCPTKGTYITVIENALLEILRDWCVRYQEPEPETTEPLVEQEMKIYQRQIETIESQIVKAQEFLELGVYAPSDYLKRRAALDERLQKLKDNVPTAPPQSTHQTINAMIPRIQCVIEAYPYAENADQKNRLLKEIIDHVDFYKTDVGRKGKPVESLMKLVVFPKTRKNWE